MTCDAHSQKPGLRSVLVSREYRRLWAARTSSQFGDLFNTVALTLLVFQLTGSGLGVSAVVLAEILPVLLFAPRAGTLVDRLPRVRVMVGADLARAALAALLPLVDGHIGAVYAVALGLSAGAVLFNPAASAIPPTLVRDDELVAANSGIWTAAVLAQIVLAPLAGLLVLAVGPQPAFLVNAVSFLISAALIRGLQVPTLRAPSEHRHILADAAHGVRIVLGDRLLRGLAGGQLLAALSAGATSALLVVLAQRQLRIGPGGYGLLLGAIGIGAALGPFLLTRLVSDPRRPGFIFGPYLLRGVVDLTLAASTAVPVALLALVGYGVGTSSGAVTFNSVLQAEVPTEARGRVFASFDLLSQLGRLASLIMGGIFADAFGIAAVYYLGGALLFLAALLGWASLHERPLQATRP
jgi:MFS family permease